MKLIICCKKRTKYLQLSSMEELIMMPLMLTLKYKMLTMPLDMEICLELLIKSIQHIYKQVKVEIYLSEIK